MPTTTRRQRPAKAVSSESSARVVDQAYDLVGVDKLQRHPENYNRGDVEAIAESIGENGFFGAVIAQRSTGHVLAGNHTLEAARKQGFAEIPTLWVDVDDERARRIVIAANETARLATKDPGKLAALLKGITNPMKGLGLPKGSVDKLLKPLKRQVELLTGGAAAKGGEGRTDGQGPAAPTGGGKYPLAIVLTAAEQRRWEGHKAKVGEKTDKGALMALLKEIEA